MPKYKYKAKNLEGKITKGMLDAQDETALYQLLRADGMYLVSSQDVSGQGRSSSKKLKKQVLADFCRQLGTLLQAGVSLVRAINIIASEVGIDPRAKSVYEELIALVRQGIPLSEAMDQQGEAFPTLLVNMMRSAEANGNIDQTALRMAGHFEKEHKLNGKVRSAMTYPLILTGLLVVVIIFVMTYLVPQFQEIFDSMDSLPVPTVILLGISKAIRTRWYVILLVLGFVIFGMAMLLRKPQIREKYDHLKLKLPIVGKLLRKIYTARFARTLCSLYTSGIPIIVALQISSTTVGNTYIQNQFGPIIDKVRAGGSLSAALMEVDGFQKKLASTIMVGEETGSLDSMLDSIADSLEYEADRALERLVTLLEPILIIIMAIIIGFVVIAVILPIYQSYSTIEQS
ncbi:MAG: type II secretion system F family protein [Anaerostipes sp.]|nr:type II secretion system F family protein [Anaerostipes sp.]